MKLQDKLYKLPEEYVRIMETQFKKDKICVNKNWYKQVLYNIAVSEFNDTFLIIFSKISGKLYSTVSIFNEVDVFEEDKGVFIVLGRMCKHTDFLATISDYYATELTTEGTCTGTINVNRVKWDC